MDLDKEQIVDWAINYASYEELEAASKALYQLYAVERKEKGFEPKKRRAVHYKAKHPNKKRKKEN